MKPIEILLVEDNPGDVRLTQLALSNQELVHHLSVVSNGVEALAFLQREGKYRQAPRPDIILLDLNLPLMDGREVLNRIKSDGDLKRIPVVILTTSDDERDILNSYDLHANCYIKKPVDINRFLKIVQAIEEFWFSIVRLPPA